MPETGINDLTRALERIAELEWRVEILEELRTVAESREALISKVRDLADSERRAEENVWRKLLYSYHSSSTKCESMVDLDVGLEGMHCSCLINWAEDSVEEISRQLAAICRERYLAWMERRRQQEGEEE